jgi:hypothetical protein
MAERDEARIAALRAQGLTVITLTNEQLYLGEADHPVCPSAGAPPPDPLESTIAVLTDHPVLAAETEAALIATMRAGVIDLPVHVHERLGQQRKARSRLTQQLGREPSPEEVAGSLG